MNYNNCRGIIFITETHSTTLWTSKHVLSSCGTSNKKGVPNKKGIAILISK